MESLTSCFRSQIHIKSLSIPARGAVVQQYEQQSASVRHSN